jgi:hypothetical protein
MAIYGPPKGQVSGSNPLRGTININRLEVFISNPIRAYCKKA